MLENENAKKLGKILCAILIVIFMIIILYFITYIFQVQEYEGYVPPETTTTSPASGFMQLSAEEKVVLNQKFNSNFMTQSFMNGIDNSFDLIGVNLLETEVSKFRFLYSYIKLNNLSNKITLDELNNYSKLIFNTTISPVNISLYLQGDYYEYEIKENLYCMKATKKKDNIWFFDLITANEINCDINYIDYDESLVVANIYIAYEVVNNNYIYKTFIVIK